MCLEGSSAVGTRASRKSSTTSVSQGSLQAASACSITHPCLLRTHSYHMLLQCLAYIHDLA